jgi:hypothetical protein
MSSHYGSDCRFSLVREQPLVGSADNGSGLFFWRIAVKWIGSFVCLAALLVAWGCAKKDPLYCDEETPCEDPALPFCDLTGEHPASEGIANTCIPDPFGGPDGSVGDASPGDAGVDAEPAECTSASECDDGLFCNGVETCAGDGICEAGTAPQLDDGVACTVDTCNESTDQVEHTPDDSACDDQNLCNGVETCHPTLGCVSGTPVQCPADTACKVYSCVPSSGNCVVNDAAYNISYDSPCGPGAVGLSCGGSADICTHQPSANCSYTCSCEMNSEGELRVHCVGESSDPQVVCSFIPAQWVSSGCSSRTTFGGIECCFP